MERYIFTRNFILTTLIVCLNALHAQTGVNDKYINVDLSRGNLNLSIPLYTLKTKTLACPVSLNYSQVDLISNAGREAFYAGSTGLGWMLNAGGLITRTIKGLPDDNQRFREIYSERDLGIGNFDNTLSNFDPMVNYEYDPEEDEFYFSFYGFTGSFIYYRGNWKIYSDDVFKINPYFSNTNELLGFRIVTQDGLAYDFGGNTLDRCENAIGYNTWYLTRVTSPEGETINFDYVKASVYYPQTNAIKTTQNTYREVTVSNDNTYGFEWQKINGPTIRYDPSMEDIQAQKGEPIEHVYLKSITCTYNLFEVDFNYIDTNEPFAINGFKRNPLKLDNISVKYLDNNFKKYTLNYDDKASETLKLRSVQEFATSGNTISGSMPSFNFEYANKNDATSPEALTKLVYPTGGYSSFLYEYDTELKNLRLKKQISQGASSDKEITTMYHYVMSTNGNLGVPEFDFSKNHYLTISGENSKLQRPASDGIATSETNFFDTHMFYEPINENTFKYSFHDDSGLYKYEIEANMGDYIYNDRAYNTTIKDKTTIYSSVWVHQTSQDALNNIHSMGYKHYSFTGFSESYLNDYDRYEIIYHNASDIGKLKQYEEFGPNGTKLKKITYEYKKINEEKLNRYAIHTVDYVAVNGEKMAWYETHKYTSSIYKYKLVKETETSEYNITKTVNYTYDPNTFLLREKKITGIDLDLNTITNQLDEDGSFATLTTNYRYMYDFDRPNGTPDGAVNIPIETIYKKDGKITGVEYIKFKTKNYDGKYVDRPETIYTLDITQPISESDYIPVSTDWSTLDPKLKPRISYAYDDYANLVEEADASGNKIAYVGQTNISNIPLIVLKGIGYTEYLNSSASNQSSINKIRALLPTVQITNYTYDPKHGTYTSVTSPNGLTTTYEYDNFGRLRYIRDNNQNLLNIYEYTTNAH